jgi:putative tricarboxylic transport membrane protein
MGMLGWLLRKLDFETAPIVLGAILAPLLEMAMRQSLAMSDGRYGIFVTRPIAAALLATGGVLLALGLRAWIARGLDWRGRLALAEKGDSS